MEKKDKRWAVSQACKRPYLLKLMEGKGLQMKEQIGNKKMQKCTKGYPALFGC